MVVLILECCRIEDEDEDEACALLAKFRKIVLAGNIIVVCLSYFAS